MKVHQIFINDSGKIPQTLPGYCDLCIKSLWDFYGRDEYHLYSGEELEYIIEKNFDKEVFLAYKSLKPYAYKADLARLCLLYLYGGLYVDLNTRFINPLEIDYLNQWNFFAFRDLCGASVRSWSISNSIIFSKEKSKVLEKAIEIIVKNCKNMHYGLQTTEPTGCIVIGKAIMDSGEYYVCTNGELICMNGTMLDAPRKVTGFFTDFGDLIAIRKPYDAGVSNFSQSNNYIDMWNNKDIYETSFFRETL